MKANTIYQKIHEAKLEIGKVAKNATNPHFKNTYADLNALIDAVEPILLEKGLVLLQPIKEGRVFTVIVDVENGEQLESFLELTPGLQSQPLGSQITYFRRYTLSSLLSLQAVDDDGKASQTNTTPKKQPITDERFEAALVSIQSGTFSKDKLESTFMLTAEQKIKLSEI